MTARLPGHLVSEPVDTFRRWRGNVGGATTGHPRVDVRYATSDGDRGLSQTVVAARMGTSRSALARLEAGEIDPRISTVERYALAVGEDLALRRRPN